MIRGVTKKIGISLREELYNWAAREVEEGRAESVSALISEGLELLEARAQLEAVVARNARGLRRESYPVQHAIEPFARFVACKHAARAVRTVRSGREAQN